MAGNGTLEFAGDGGAAGEAAIGAPSAVAGYMGTDLLVGDLGNRRIRRIDASGIITTWAGTGETEVSGEGGPATLAGMIPLDLAVSGEGLVYTLEADRVRVIDQSGVIRRVAGSELSGFAGDGGPALDARFDDASGIAVGDDGSVYVADTDNNRVRRIDPSGIIDTVPGNGVQSSSGDGGLAVDASLNRPSDVAVTADGTLHIAEVSGNRIRKVLPDGTIQTLAGIGGTGAFSGDGGLATAAQPWAPWGVDVCTDGSVLIADSGNYRVRVVGTDGVIQTIAGDGTTSYDGDGQLATEAALWRPIRATPFGDEILVVDSFMGRVRRLVPGKVPVAFSDLRGSLIASGRRS